MRAFAKTTLVALALVGNDSTASSPALVGDRSSEQILKALDETKVPTYDSLKKGDQAYTSQFLTELQKATKTRDALILELYQTDPDHARIPALMAERWSIRPYALPREQLLADIDETLAHTKNPKVRIEGIYARAYAKIYGSPKDKPIDLTLMDEYIKLAPKDPRGATLLQLAARRTNDESVKTALEDRLLKEFPEASVSLRLAGTRELNNKLGKPFLLEFKDAISGSAVSMAKLKGKLVVIDFWATWCGPCVLEMPAMKKLYAKYHDQGVEFLGISLDYPEAQGGLGRLRKYVKENEIAWPQYYQGDGWDSKFSSDWGIHAIPAVFVVDTIGNLYSTEAQGKLDTIIPELLAKPQAKGK
jgi:thiol-disulfide isomerase/thioredoxin